MNLIKTRLKSLSVPQAPQNMALIAIIENEEMTAQNYYNKLTRKVWAYETVQSQRIQLIVKFMMLFTCFGFKRFYSGKFWLKNSIQRNPIMITHFWGDFWSYSVRITIQGPLYLSRRLAT